jgi:DinB superfamily
MPLLYLPGGMGGWLRDTVGQRRDKVRRDRQLWNQQQQQLRQLIRAKGPHEDIIRVFLGQHAMVHAAAMAHTGAWSFEDEVLDGAPEDHLRRQPDPGANSIIWLVWHIARTEDVTMNLLLAGRPQVLHDNTWPERLGVARLDIGTSMDDREVSDISAQVDIATVRAYRLAVGRRTRAIAGALRPADLWRQVDAARVQRVLAEGALAEAASGLADVWGGWKRVALLGMPATRHSFTHLSAALRVREQLARQAQAPTGRTRRAGERSGS